MRKVVLFVATSIDGFIAGKDGNTDWLYTDGDFGYHAFYDSIDTTIMGYNTYFYIRNFAKFPYPDKTNFVFTRKERMADDNPVKFVMGDVADFTLKLKAESGKNIWLVGGGRINSLLLNANLIDQMIISVHPVALGHGVRLFRDESLKNFNFRLVRHEVFERSLVQLTYENG